MSATFEYGNPTYPPPPENSAYPPPPANPVYPLPHTYPPPSENSTYPPPPSNPAYQPPPVSQPVMTSTSNVTVVNTAPAPVAHVSAVSPSPQNYLVLNIITLLFCCFVFGLIGMMYSLKVDSEWNSGNHQGAHDAARMARNWGIAGIITGVVLIILVIAVIAASAAASGSTASDDTEYNYYDY